jgi:putative nucleotidyltransferase with HDIG domain
MRDPYTYDHQRRVSFLSEALAKKLGLSEERIRLVKLAGLVHDIGKVAVPAEILNKPGRLSDVEMEIVRTHPQKGYELLRKLTHRPVLAEIVYAHHERLDGSGYPRGLSGKDIPIEARILAVADVVEAMVSHRPFKSALTLEETLEEIKAGKGILYDRRVVEACVELFERGSFSFEDAPLS